MNWKRFLAETAIWTGLTGVGLFYAPAILAAEAGAVILGAEVAIGALGFWGLCKAWDHLWTKAPVETKQVAPVQHEAKANQKTNELERTKQKRWMKAPKLIGRWHPKNRQHINENQREAA